MSDNRPARYIDDDGIIVYRASAIGMCDRIFAALDQGYDPMAHPEWFQRVLDEGTDNEQAIRDMWSSRTGEPVINDQKLIELEVMDGVVIRGHIDGETRSNNLWEGKKFRASTWDKFMRSGVECMPTYPMQTSIYMHGGKYEGMHFVGGLYDSDDKQEIVDIYEHHYEMPPLPLLAIRKRVAKLEGIINDGIYVMDVACPKTPMYPCPFFYLHDDDAPEPKERPGDEVITGLLTEWVVLQQQREEPAAKVAAIEKRLKELKGGVEGWWTASGLQGGDSCKITGADGKAYEVKLVDVARKGYEVKPTGYSKVTVKSADDKTSTKTKKTTTKGDK